jgi:glutamyl-Q tRNA(Asp) synthetase
MTYRGRFAPTPSGPLHLGSLLTALASYLQARAQDGQWLIRIDDLDHLRCVPGATAEILRQLESHGLLWDETPRYQADHLDQYTAALDSLRDRDLLYACTCTRAELAANDAFGPYGPLYAGTCRFKPYSIQKHALRLRVPNQTLEFVDGWQDAQRRALASEIGDFVVQRNDGVISYQLACAVDEAAQGITEVVRGADLLGSSFRQLHVQQQLGLPHALYCHLPILVDAGGHKLSKQNHADAIGVENAATNLKRCLRWLGQEPPGSLEDATTGEILNWAIKHWTPGRIPRQPSLVVE